MAKRKRLRRYQSSNARKVVQQLAELYGKPFDEVFRVYNSQNYNIGNTRMILNLSK